MGGPPPAAGFAAIARIAGAALPFGELAGASRVLQVGEVRRRESALMAHHDTRHDARFHELEPARFDGLHPAIYKALAGFALWMVVAAWVSFSGQGYASFALAVITGFFLVAAAIPFIFWRVWRKTDEGRSDGAKPAFSDWWRGEFETWQGRVEGWDAAVEVLLPLGVAAIGMTLIGLVFRLTPGS